MRWIFAGGKGGRSEFLYLLSLSPPPHSAGRKVAGVPAFVILAVGLALVPTVSTTYGLVVVSVIMGFGNGLSSGLNQVGW